VDRIATAQNAERMQRETAKTIAKAENIMEVQAKNFNYKHLRLHSDFEFIFLQ